jgi:hypothetical protein
MGPDLGKPFTTESPFFLKGITVKPEHAAASWGT